jgi:hypothetical protein
MHNKLRSLLAHITLSTAPTPQLVYAVNAKIVSTLAYPLQVVPVPAHILQRWDREVRKAIKTATQIPVMATQAYYQPVEELGLGLRSIEAIARGLQAKAYICGLNDTWHKEGKSIQTTLCKVMRAGADRHSRVRAGVTKAKASVDGPRRHTRQLYPTLHEAATRALDDLDITVSKRAAHKCYERVVQQDQEHVEALRDQHQ